MQALVYHEGRMRRALSIFLILFFGFGPLTATLSASDEANLPACCRRNGAHHCAMSMAMRAWMVRSELRTPGFTAPAHCPFYPRTSSTATAPAHALAVILKANSALTELPVDAVPYCAAIHAPYRLALSVRGPPASAIA